MLNYFVLLDDTWNKHSYHFWRLLCFGSNWIFFTVIIIKQSKITGMLDIFNLALATKKKLVWQYPQLLGLFWFGA